MEQASNLNSSFFLFEKDDDEPPSRRTKKKRKKPKRSDRHPPAMPSSSYASHFAAQNLFTSNNYATKFRQNITIFANYLSRHFFIKRLFKNWCIHYLVMV